MGFLVPYSPLDRETDVVFLVDASRNVSREVFRAQKNLIKSLTSHFHISPYGPRGSAVIYAENSRILSTFTDPNMVERVERAALVGTPRRMDVALELADRILSGSGKNTRKIAVLLTAGRQAPGGKSLDKAVEPLRRLGAQTFVVAVGRTPDEREISTVVDRPQDIFRVTNFGNIFSQTKPIAKTVRDKPGMKLKEIGI